MANSYYCEGRENIFDQRSAGSQAAKEFKCKKVFSAGKRLACSKLKHPLLRVFFDFTKI